MPISRTTIWNDRGFTLVELAVITFIIGLMLSLVVPLLGKPGDADLRTSGRRLAGTIKYLYNQAVLDKLNHRLTFDLDHGFYRVTRQEENGEWKPLPDRRWEAGLPGAVIIKKIWIKGRGSFTSGEVAVQIYPEGWLDETVLHLQEGKYKLTLRLSPLTGKTEFYEGHRDFL
jgi:competence protein ComGC